MPSAKKDYELIEHTADVGIRVKGKDLKELFQNAASAMFDIIAEIKLPSRQVPPQILADPPISVAGTRSPVKTITIEQKAENVEELFINWLNELLSLSSAKEVIFSNFIIHSISEKTIKATAAGQSSKAFRSNVEIKAATYHQLKVARAGKMWQAEVIFDV